MSTPRSPSIQSQPVSVDSFGRLDYVPVAKRSISGSASQQSEQSKEELVLKQDAPIVTRSRRARSGTKDKLKCDVGPSSPLAPGFEYVEAIRSHRISDEEKRREFLIEWSGARDETLWTWEPETNLGGCVQMLAEYCYANQLDQPDQSGAVAGCSNREIIRLNPANWVTAGQILGQVKRLANQPLYKSPYGLFNPGVKFERTGDFVYLDIFRSHAFVYAYSSESRSCRVADGANLYIEEEDYRQEINKRLGIKAEGILYESQYKVDHCGSSAAIIMLSCMRHMRSGNWPSVFKANVSMRKDITRRLHKEPSLPMPDRRYYTIGQRERPKCPFCGQGWVKLRACDLRKHMESCRRKSLEVSGQE